MYWYSVRLSRPPKLRSCAACRKSLTPGTLAALGRRRWMTCWAEASRSENGFNWMYMRATFSDGLNPLVPPKPDDG